MKTGQQCIPPRQPDGMSKLLMREGMMTWTKAKERMGGSQRAESKERSQRAGSKEGSQRAESKEGSQRAESKEGSWRVKGLEQERARAGEWRDVTIRTYRPIFIFFYDTTWLLRCRLRG